MLRTIMTWRNVLPELIASGSFRTQAELVHALERATGQRVNQATISRELQALGAYKDDGAYRLPSAPDLAAPVHRFLVTAHGCLGVITTDPAFANVLGQSIDDAEVPGVLGTIAGDDTVFVAMAGEAAAASLRHFLGLSPEARRSA